MSDTPDLDKARNVAQVMLIEKGNNYEEPIDAVEDTARLILEQRAEEAERCAEFVAFVDSVRLDKRVADLRRQAGKQ